MSTHCYRVVKKIIGVDSLQEYTVLGIWGQTDIMECQAKDGSTIIGDREGMGVLGRPLAHKIDVQVKRAAEAVSTVLKRFRLWRKAHHGSFLFVYDKETCESSRAINVEANISERFKNSLILFFLLNLFWHSLLNFIDGGLMVKVNSSSEFSLLKLTLQYWSLRKTNRSST